MRLRTRITLITFGVLIFVIFAPAIVLFATGFRYDFENNRLLKTGTIAIRTEPRQAEISINGEKQPNGTPFAKRFLLPGEYTIEISKPGYRSWKKKITVLEERVSFLPSNGREKIFLFESTLIQTTLATNTSDFIEKDSSIYFVNKNDIFQSRETGKLPTLLATATVGLGNPKILDIDLTVENNPSFLVKDSAKNYYIKGKQTIELDPALKSPRFNGQSNILAINGQNQLVEFEPSESARIIAQNVLAFLNTDNIYYLSKNNSANLQLWIMSSNGTPTLLRDNLPNAQTAEMIVSETNQILLLLDADLYLISDNLKKLNGGTVYAYWDKSADRLVYGNEHEIWIYQPTQDANGYLVTRAAKNLGIPAYNHETGYVFVAEENELKAIEYDVSGQPNIYSFDETENPISKLVINPAGTHLIYLDGTNLFSLKIR